MSRNTPKVPVSANRLLENLPPDEYRRLSPLLKAVPLTVKQVLHRVHETIDYVYFPTSGSVSAMAVMRDGRAIEVVATGKEGMTGLSAFLGAESSTYEVIVQVAGEAVRMKLDDFRRLNSRAGPVRELLARYYSAYSLQVSYAVACTGLHRVEQRCCRWLLMAQDREGSNMLTVTHESLGEMLGVRRASVTDVLRPLQIKGVVRNSRGNIEILDRPRLEKLACECYGEVSAQFKRLFK